MDRIEDSQRREAGMSAVGYVSGDPNKVNVTGDTMTGDLILAGAGTDLTVGGVLTDTYQGVTADVMSLLSTVISTGVTSGGLVTINANPALADISPTTGQIVDYDANGVLGPTNPALTTIAFPGATGVALTGPPAQILTYWLINSAGVLIQQPNFPTPTQLRTHLCLGVTGQIGGIIQGTQQIPVMNSQNAVQSLGLMVALGTFPATDGLVSPNGVNLMINYTGGDLFAPGFNFPNYQNPNIATLAPQAPATFHRATATAILPALQTTIDVGNYDPGGLGVVTPIPNPPSTTTIHRVYGEGNPVVSEQLIVQYGQTAYATLGAAVAAIGAGTFIRNPLTGGGALLAWIAVTKSATDLSSITQASFTHAAKFDHP
jgi:hypothetical protein